MKAKMIETGCEAYVQAIIPPIAEVMENTASHIVRTRLKVGEYIVDVVTALNDHEAYSDATYRRA